MSSDFTESETSSSSNTSHGPGLNMSVEIVQEVMSAAPLLSSEASENIINVE